RPFLLSGLASTEIYILSLHDALPIYEFKGEKTVVLANGERAFHVTALVKSLTDKITIITQGTPDFKEEQLIKLQKNKIRIIEKEERKSTRLNSSHVKITYAVFSLTKQ